VAPSPDDHGEATLDVGAPQVASATKPE
jgi:hypothetical protein